MRKETSKQRTLRPKKSSAVSCLARRQHERNRPLETKRGTKDTRRQDETRHDTTRHDTTYSTVRHTRYSTVP